MDWVSETNWRPSCHNRTRDGCPKFSIAHVGPDHSDWIVLNNTMKVLGEWAKRDPDLARWLQPHAARLAADDRRSVASNARKLLDQLDRG